jgi:putative copper export protein
VDFSIALEATPKAMVYASVMLCVGAAVGRGLLRFKGERRLTAIQRAELADAFRRLAITAPLILVVALTLRAWAHTAAAFGIPESISYQNLHTIALESQWGTGWRLQMAAAVALSIISASMVIWPRGGWFAAGVAATAMCYVLPLLGHAAGEAGATLVHGSHILGGGIWVGTLAAMSIAARDADSAHTASPPSVPAQRRELLGQFSPVALVGSTLLLLTGLTLAWWYLGPWPTLWTTTYGRLLILKLLLVAGVAACGFVNWQTLRRPLTSTELPGTLRLVVGLEIALAASVVVVTALLTETGHP